VILFSSLKKSGIEDVRNTLTELIKAKMDT